MRKRFKYAGRISTLPRPDYSVSISQSTGKTQFSHDNPKRKNEATKLTVRLSRHNSSFFTFNNFFADLTIFVSSGAEKTTAKSA
jgi:hypothetical protein